MDLSKQSATEILKLLESRSVSATECLQHFNQRIASQKGSLGAFLTLADRSAEEQAADIDSRRARGKPVGRLAGLPVAIKDGICTKGIRTTAGSRILNDFVPPYNATVVQRLIDEDAILIGKTHMDEFAMGSSTENPHFGNCRNPWDPERVAGGSSGGSAVAIAADMAPLSLGSDTGGSIRQPASFCGVTGLKPTYGRVSRLGLIAFASSLDQIGPITHSAADAALMLEVIAGHDPNDATSSRQSVPEFLNSIEQPIEDIRIGVCRDQLGDSIDDDVRVAIEDSISVLKECGATMVDVEFPYSKYAVAAYYVIAPSEASSNLARYDGVRYTMRSESSDLDQMYCQTRSDGFGPEVQRRILLGTFALSSGYYDEYYLKASRVRRLIKDSYDKIFKNVDLILGPTTPTAAFEIGEKIADPVAMYMADVFTVSANLAGNPAISTPAGFTKKGLPVGLQLQARPFEESLLLRVAHHHQQSSGHWRERPNLNAH